MIANILIVLQMTDYKNKKNDKNIQIIFILF